MVKDKTADVATEFSVSPSDIAVAAGGTLIQFQDGIVATFTNTNIAPRYCTASAKAMADGKLSKTWGNTGGHKPHTTDGQDITSPDGHPIRVNAMVIDLRPRRLKESKDGKSWECRETGEVVCPREVD